MTEEREIPWQEILEALFRRKRLVIATTLLGISGAVLYGVTGDGAPSNPESFFTVSTADASTSLVHPLGNGSGGEGNGSAEREEVGSGRAPRG